MCVCVCVWKWDLFFWLKMKLTIIFFLVSICYIGIIVCQLDKKTDSKLINGLSSGLNGGDLMTAASHHKKVQYYHHHHR